MFWNRCASHQNGKNDPSASLSSSPNVVGFVLFCVLPLLTAFLSLTALTEGIFCLVVATLVDMVAGSQPHYRRTRSRWWTTLGGIHSLEASMFQNPSTESTRKFGLVKLTKLACAHSWCARRGGESALITVNDQIVDLGPAVLRIFHKTSEVLQRVTHLTR